MEHLIEQVKSLNFTVAAALIAALASLIVGIMNFGIQKKNLKLQTKIMENQLTNETLTNNRKQLEEFYYPFKTYLSESYRLYSIFRNGLPKDFRTLIYLIDNSYKFQDIDGVEKMISLDKNRLSLLNKIFEIEEKLYDLVVKKGGMIKDPALCDIYTPNSRFTDIILNFDPNRPEGLPTKISLLGLFMVHCTLIKMAYQGQLPKDNIEIYSGYIYPRELNKKIDDNITLLNKENEDLESQIQNR